MAGSFQTRLGDSPEEGIKSPVVVATTANITLSGEQTINTVAVVAGNRVLVRAQTDPLENGIYNASAGAWTRSTDWNRADDVVNGVLVTDASNGKIYQALFVGDYEPDVTSVQFNQSEVGASVVTERTVLTDGQLIINLVNTVPNWTSFYLAGLNVDGGRLDDPDDYSYNASLYRITLTESYPAGTVLIAVASDT